MTLVRLIYASRFAQGVGPNDIQDILSVSREHNEAAGITGILCYNPRYFLQVLEGPRDEVNKLYKHICTDERHEAITLLHYDDIAGRIFEEWAMAYLRTDDLTKHIVLKYSPDTSFNPYTMTADQALNFAVAISEERQQFLDSIKH